MVPILVNAFGVFFMRQYIISLPDELIEAARVDGAGELTIFFRVVFASLQTGPRWSGNIGGAWLPGVNIFGRSWLAPARICLPCLLDLHYSKRIIGHHIIGY